MLTQFDYVRALLVTCIRFVNLLVKSSVSRHDTFMMSIFIEHDDFLGYQYPIFHINYESIT